MQSRKEQARPEVNDKIALFLAIRSGDIKLVKKLIDCDAKVNICCNDITPLYVAIVNNNYEMAKLLIDRGADVDAVYCDKTLLMIAVDQENIPIVKLLIEKSADLNVVDDDNQSVLMIAVNKNSKKIVKLLIDHDVKTTIQESFETIFFAAWKNSNFDICELLLDVAIKIIPLLVEKIIPTFHRAVIKNDNEAINCLIDDGMDINEIFWKKTPLHIAVEKQNIEMVDFLINNGADVNAHAEDGRTVLLTAVEKNNFELVSTLINSGADLNLLTDFELPINQAINTNNYKMAEYLLANGAFVNGVDGDKTPLYCAVKNTNKKMVKLLVKNKADLNLPSLQIFHSPIHPGTKCSKITALGVAVEQGSAEFIEILINAGADVNFSSDDCFSPLQHAIVENNLQMAKYLIKHRANVNAVCHGHNKKLNEIPNYTLLHFAVSDNKIEMIKLLIDNKIDLNPIKAKDCSIIFDILKNGCSKILKLLLDVGLNVDCTDIQSGNSPLQVAVESNDLEKVKLLLMSENCANINAVISGDSILHHAARYANKSILNVILNAGVDVNLVNETNFLKGNEANRVTIIEHMVKLKAANFHLNNTNLKFINKKRFDNLYVKCINEMKRMKLNNVPNTSITYYDVLIKGVHELAASLRRNPNIKFGKMLFSNFPLYSGLLLYRLSDAKRRLELLGTANEKLSLIFYRILPFDTVTQINCHLSNRHLKMLSF